jgi:hypothetical protein
MRQGQVGGWCSWCPFWLLFGQAKSDKKAKAWLITKNKSQKRTRIQRILLIGADS